jgi:cytoskeletal protein RodZ
MLQDSVLDPHEPANDYVADEANLADHAEGHDDVGSILKRTRNQSGYTLDQVSQALNIRSQHIAAIEESRVDDLPGLPYAVGFVKAYANFLGLDDHAIVARYKEEVQLVPGAQRLSFPEPVDEARVPKGTIITLSMAAALAIYGVWYFVSSYDAVKMVSVPDVPDRVATNSVGPKSISPVSTESAAPEANPTTAVAETAKTPEKTEQRAEAATTAVPTKTEAPQPAAAPTQTEPTKVAAAENTVEKTAPAVAPAPAAPAATSTAANDSEAEDIEQSVGSAEAVDETPAAESSDPIVAALGTPTQSAPAAGDAAPAIEAPHIPKTYGSDSSDVRVVIRAATDSWVQVEAADEDILLSRVLKAGDSYRVPNRDGLTMMTGNAGALDIVVDGQSIGSLGPLGAVRKGIELEPSALEARASTNTASRN